MRSYACLLQSARSKKNPIFSRPATMTPAALAVFCLLFFVVSCASSRQLPAPPPKYMYQNGHEEPTAAAMNSLWVDRAGLFEDNKARRLNDLVTINVVENIAGSGQADTKTGRDSSADYGISDLFGTNLDFNIQNLPLVNGLYRGGNVFKPAVKGSAQSDFDGSGDTNKAGKLIGTITAMVVEVMPNGNLIIESRKDITINHDSQVLVLRGMIRPEDIGSNNTILSSKVANARLYYVGEGVIDEKQKPGWLVRIMDQVWPF